MGLRSDFDDLRDLLDRNDRIAHTLTIEVDERYRRAIEIIEGLPSNQSGSDKTWIEQLEADSRRHFNSARRLR